MIVILDIDRFFTAVFESLFDRKNRLTAVQANGFLIAISPATLTCQVL
ncbi:MAG: hypothetical protein GY815_09540 [Gammaproteobacteria bacterium]|nr:hypothetical protein [Gammaproteobacteria bacterium]